MNHHQVGLQTKLQHLNILRLVTSVYEAANIHSILHCREKGKDKTPLWFMYVTATVQFLMVTKLCASFHLIIPLIVGCKCILQSANLLFCWEIFP